MEITGDNWDAAIYARLAADPPPAPAGWEDRHEHTLRLVIDTIGPSLRGFLGAALPRLAAAAEPGGDDPAHRFVDWLASYYLLMHQAFHETGPQGLPGWGRALDAARDTMRGEGGGPRVFLTFQIGLPLLCPPLISATRGRPVRVLMHRRNRFAEDFYRASLPAGGPLFLEDVTSHGIAGGLRAGEDIFANVDVAYPGSRSAPMPLLGAALDAPSGLPLLARRAGASLQPVALLWESGALRLAAAPPTNPARGDFDGGMSPYASFFEGAIRRCPFQWFGWPSLRPAAG